MVLTRRDPPGFPSGDDGQPLVPSPFHSCQLARCAVALRPRKNKSRQNKYHRCQRCGGQVRKHHSVARSAPRLSASWTKARTKSSWRVACLYLRNPPPRSSVTHGTAARRTRLRLPVMHRGHWPWTGSSGRARSRGCLDHHRQGDWRPPAFPGLGPDEGRDTGLAPGAGGCRVPGRPPVRGRG